MAEELATFEPASQLVFPSKRQIRLVEKDDGDIAPATLNIKNQSSSSSLLFRVQTTSPHTYRVKPSHGRIAPSASLDVLILFASPAAAQSAMQQSAGKSDKFLIKYGLVDADAPQLSGEQFIQQFNGIADVRELRLKTVFGDDQQNRTQSVLSPSRSISPVSVIDEEAKSVVRNRSIGTEEQPTLTNVVRPGNRRLTDEQLNQLPSVEPFESPLEPLIQAYIAVNDRITAVLPAQFLEPLAVLLAVFLAFAFGLVLSRCLPF